MFQLHQKIGTNGATRTGSGVRIEGIATPADIHVHVVVCDEGEADLLFRFGGYDVAGQLVVALGLNVSPMVLVEVADLVHKVDGGCHAFRQGDGGSAVLAEVAGGLVQGRVVEYTGFGDLVHDHEESDGQRNEQHGHDDVEDDGLLESSFAQLGVNEEQVHKLIVFGVGRTHNYAISLFHAHSLAIYNQQSESSPTDSYINMRCPLAITMWALVLNLIQCVQCAQFIVQTIRQQIGFSQLNYQITYYITPMQLSSPRRYARLLQLAIMTSILMMSCRCIHPTQPIVVNPNTQSSPSNFIFAFALQNTLPSNGYLMITFSTFTNTGAVPISCLVLDNLNLTISTCVNLNSGGNAITIAQSAINSVNVNINAAKTVVMQFSSALSPGVSYKIQVMTTNVLPNIGSITKSFEFYTLTNTGVMIEENWNFGQVFLEPKQNIDIAVVNRNSMVSNLPGKSFTNLLFEITIGVATPTPNARLKFVISGGFTFTDSSIVATQSLVGPAPTILSSVIVSPNVIITTFNEAFVVGRKFTLTIADYKSPLSISSGYISIYHLPFNSMSPLQISEQNIPLQTVPFTPTLTLLTVDGTAPLKPIQFYTSTTQYIQLQIVIPRDVDSTFTIQISADTLVIHEGSVYIKTNTVDSAKINYNFYAAGGVKITGFPTIPDSSLITVTMRVEVPSNPIFTITVKVDADANLANPIILGTVTSNSAAIPETFISALTGSQGEPNKISWMKNTDSLMSFTVTPTFQTNAGSLLKIITSSNLIATPSFVGVSSCLVAGVAQPCSVTSNLTYTTILIASNSSYNLFPQAAPTTVVINNLSFKFASSHSTYIYHFYFSLIVSQAVVALEKSLIMVPCVIPERDLLTAFSSYFSNNLNNSGMNFPNVVRLVNTNPAQWQNVIQAWERRIISVFAYEGWTNLFLLSNGDAYPATGNIAGFTYTYMKGTSSSIDISYPIDWDRVDIILDGNQTSTSFSIVLPTTFISSSPDYHYQIMVGVYNTITRQIQYLNVEPQPVSPNPTYIMPTSVSLSAKPKVLTNKIQLAGYAGSYKSNVNITITPGGGTYSGNGYSSALIVVSDWRWFDDSSSFASLSLASNNPQFQNVEQTPKSIFMPRNQKYFTYIPLKTTASISSQFLIYMNSVKLPYTDDLPYYSIYLIDDTGTINCYNEFINQDKSVFYYSYLASLSFSCNVISLGVTNTYCTVDFTPNNDIELSSVLVVYFTGMQVSTSTCSMTQLPSTLIPGVCSSNTDKNQLSLTMQNTQRLPALNSYRVIVYGISIISTTIIQNIKVSIMDPTNSYVIETGVRILLTSVDSFNPIYISEVKYSKNNPIVYSSFYISFQLPRQLNSDEVFAIVMSKDLSNLNTISSKLNVVLRDSTGTVIPCVWSLNLRNYQILFQGMNNVLTAASYSIQIHGLKTPSTIEQDLISIIYLRTFDSSYTVYNNAQSTTQFPQLADKINSLIIMMPYFNTEGLEQQFSFSVQNQWGQVNVNTVWYLNFPRYYSEHLWNEDYLIYCTINDVPIQCGRDLNTPYQVIISNSPRIVETGQTYILKVYGLQCPRATYLNGNAAYVTESIFLGIAENSTASSFTEYSELFLTDTIIDTETQAGFGAITVKGIESSNMEVLQSTFFTINATSSVGITAGQWIYLTFPQEFNNFHDLPLTVEVVQGANDMTYTAEVVNRRIGFNMSTMSITANTLFSIKISSLPTPSVPGSVDMNKLRIMAATVDRLGTTAASLQLHNLVSSITFIPSALHIVINNYTTIMVTAGTYSLPILIQPSDFGVFVSNMKISFVSDALVFGGSPAYMYLGDTSGTFSVGADQTLIPTLYAFDIIKTEASISAFYASLTKYTVLVSNTPIQITMPASFNVPLGGCSVPYLVTLSNSPYSDLSIAFQYDTRLYNLHLFWVNEQTSYNELDFDKTITRRWLSFCADAGIGLTGVTVTAFLGGTNYKAYQLSNTVINVNIDSNATTAVAPTCTLATRNLQKTYAGFEVTVNLPGQIYYEVMLTNSNSFLDLISLKASVKEYNLLLQSQANYLSYIYGSERYRRVGMKSVTSGANPLQFNDLLPGQSYTLCLYFENQHRVDSSQICTTFSTMAWGSVTKAIITFTQTVYENQLNKVLCFFVKASESKINQVVDLEGRSCSLSNSAQNYNYLYKGTTQTNQLSQTTIYMITNANLTTDPSMTKFSNIYNANGITAASLSLALSSFAVNYIKSSSLVSTFYPPDIISGSATFTPTFTFDEPAYDNSSNSISVSNMMLDKAGSVYFIVTFSRKIEYNKITGHTDINIRPALTPSSEQVLNCYDGYGSTPLQCTRVMFMANVKRSLTFPNISSNSIYTIYYVLANEYPLRPVVVSEVTNFTVLTTFENMASFILAALLVLAVAYA